MTRAILFLMMLSGCSTFTTPMRECKSMCGGRSILYASTDVGERCECPPVEQRYVKDTFSGTYTIPGMSPPSSSNIPLDWGTITIPQYQQDGGKK